MTTIHGGTAVFGLIGDPIDHSLSPFIVNRAFAAAGIDARYVAFPVRGDRVGEAIAGLGAAGVRGLNVTYPHKTAAAKSVASLSETARLLDAVNTIRFDDAGAHGDNTDAAGTANALSEFAATDPSGARVFVFGGGGAARAAAVGLLERGASSITLAARTRGSADGFANRCRTRFGLGAIRLLSMSEEDAADRRAAIGAATVVINATPLGMEGHDETLDGLDALVPGHTCFEFVYRPARTPFLRAAEDAGARTLGGLALLVCQAALGFAAWTGEAFDTREMMEAASAHLETIDKERA